MIILYNSDVGKYKELIDIPAISTLQHLKDIGLIDFNEFRNFDLNVPAKRLSYNGSLFEITPILSSPLDTGYIQIGEVVLTKIGSELAHVCQPSINPLMIDYAIQYWTHSNNNKVEGPYPVNQE